MNEIAALEKKEDDNSLKGESNSEEQSLGEATREERPVPKPTVSLAETTNEESQAPSPNNNKSESASATTVQDNDDDDDSMSRSLRSNNSRDSIGRLGITPRTSPSSSSIRNRPRTYPPSVSSRPRPPPRTFSNSSNISSSSSIHRGGPQISWKSDPKESFSDWRVEIQHQESAKSAVYNLHRNIVGFGPRRSHFFHREFEKQQELEEQGQPHTKFTCIQVADAKQILAFPMVLDFMYYTREVKQTLTAERACCVYRLAEQLDIPPLQQAIVDFYSKRTSLRNMGGFVTSATLHKVTPLVMTSKAKIATLILEKPELAGLIPPKLMAAVLKARHDEEFQRHYQRQTQHLQIANNPKAQSWLWSRAVLTVLSRNDMTMDVYDQLTHEAHLPFIDPSVALRFLLVDPLSQARNISNAEQATTSLQKRCVASITEDWDVFQKGFPSPEGASQALQQLPSRILADILVKNMMSSPKRENEEDNNG